MFTAKSSTGIKASGCQGLNIIAAFASAGLRAFGVSLEALFKIPAKGAQCSRVVLEAFVSNMNHNGHARGCKKDVTHDERANRNDEKQK